MRFLLTAGPTREAIDPVRYLSNRSSGRMGYALAREAARRGHPVVLVSGPVALETPPGVRRIDVISAEDMFEAVETHQTDVDVAILSAAVADYRPSQIYEQKVKKGAATEWTLTLKRTRDILGSMRDAFGYKGYLVGFAAETENLLENAIAKCKGKGCDLIVANDVSRPDIGFDSAENEVVLCFNAGSTEPLSKMSKSALSARILDRIESALTIS